MEIKRINSYKDNRFSDKVLKQHGAFTADGSPCEVEIISDTEAVFHGDEKYSDPVLEEFRLYAEHITKFYNEQGNCIKEYESAKLFDVPLSKIQPSQFYVDRDKKQATASFITKPEDIVIPLIKSEDRYISIDGHTRMSVAVDMGFDYVKGFVTECGDWCKIFVEEAKKRGILSPYDLVELDHEEYDIKWNKFCDDIFAKE